MLISGSWDGYVVIHVELCWFAPICGPFNLCVAYVAILYWLVSCFFASRVFFPFLYTYSPAYIYIHQHLLKLLKLLVICLTTMFEFYLSYFYAGFDSRMWHLSMVNIGPRGMSWRTRNTLWSGLHALAACGPNYPTHGTHPILINLGPHTLDKNIYKQKYTQKYKTFFVKKQNSKNKLYQQKME